MFRVLIQGILVILIAAIVSCLPQSRIADDIGSSQNSQDGASDAAEIEETVNEAVVSSIAEAETIENNIYLPDVLPDFVPIMPGLELIETDTSLEGNIMASFESIEALSSIKTWYEEELSEHGWIIQPTLRTDDTPMSFRQLYERNSDGLHLLCRDKHGYISLKILYFPETGE